MYTLEYDVMMLEVIFPPPEIFTFISTHFLAAPC